MIFTQLIQTNLRTKELGKNIEYYNRLDSTNTEAWELVEEGNNHGTIVITENQLKGRKGYTYKIYNVVQIRFLEVNMAKKCKIVKNIEIRAPQGLHTEVGWRFA